MPTARPARLLAALFLPLLTPAALPADGDDPVPPPPPLVGTVVDAAGAPVAGAEVGTLSETGPAYTLTTDAAGRFAMPLGRLPDGRVEYPQVLARGPGGDLGILMSADPGHFGEPWAPGVNRDGTLTVALAPPRRVPVLVKGPDGSPVAGVTARAVVREFSADAAATDADGLAVLSVPRQALGVRVVAAEGGVGYGDAALGNVVGPSAADPGDGPDGPTAVALVPTFAQRFRLVAVGRGGETRPAAGAEVRVTLIDRTEAESGYRTSAGAHLDGVGPLIAVAGADGAVTLDWLPADLRRATFEASLPGHATVPLEVVGDSVGDERTVELPADGTLAGRVRFPDGRPAAGRAGVRDRGRHRPDVRLPGPRRRRHRRRRGLRDPRRRPETSTSSPPSRRRTPAASAGRGSPRRSRGGTGRWSCCRGRWRTCRTSSSPRR